ncbi:MAG: hypothetical protein JXA20_14450 [Spirochaetes bacterium]|nr:hypothetical protein [Spirochaetota bacterium]
MNSFTSVIIPHLIGLFFIVLGWYISILNVGLARFQTNVLFSRWTLIGLILIVLGAYIPNAWGLIRRKKS